MNTTTSSLETVVAAEQEAAQIIATAQADASATVQAAESARTEALQQAKERLASERSAALQKQDDVLAREVAAIEQQAEQDVAILRNSAASHSPQATAATVAQFKTA